MTSNETKDKYIDLIESIVKQEREPIVRKENTINMNFVGQPFFEIKGSINKEFNVSFLDGRGNLVHNTKLSTNMWTKLNRKYFENWTIKIESDGITEVIKYDAKNKRVYISLDSKSLGDSIAWVPYLEEFRKKHDCKLIVSTFWNKLFESKYPEIEFVKPGDIVNSLYAMYSIGWFYDSNKEPQYPNTIPLQKTATNILGLEFTEIKPEINFIPGLRPQEKKYVTIAPHSTSGLKYWNNETGWKDLIKYLISNGYDVINVSLDNVDYEGVINSVDKSIEETMNIIHHSEFFIGLSSGLSWLSWSIGKHVVMISNFTEADHEFTTNCTRITNTSVCNSCWNNPNFKFDKGDWNWCPVNKGTSKQFECHVSITAEMVISSLQNIL